MSSTLQIAANRQNSQRSTGPRSATGKAIASQNAFKTSIYSEAEVVRGENPADLDALATAYHQRFQPQAPEESCLVDILVHSEWILRRLRRAEAELCELNTLQSEDNFDPGELELARAVDCDDSIVLLRLQRRVDSTQRNYLRALKEIKQLQAERPIGFVPSPELGAADAAAPVRIPCESEAGNPAPAIGFVPSTARTAVYSGLTPSNPPAPVEGRSDLRARAIARFEVEAAEQDRMSA